MDVVKKSGAFYSFGDTRLGQGRENAKAFLKDHGEIADEIAMLIKGTPADDTPAVDAPSTDDTADEAADEPVPVGASPNANGD